MSDEGDSLSQRYYGVYLASVRDVEDPDELGRVRLDADQYEDTDEDITWATVTRPLAGAAFSVFFTPKEGDQVVISYLGGDVRQPVVLGYAHSTERKPTDASATKHVIEIKDVGRIVFEESESDPKIVIEHAGGGSITLTADKVAIQANEVCVNGQGVVLERFISLVFDQHLHPAATPNTEKPVPIPLPGVEVKTSC